MNAKNAFAIKSLGTGRFQLVHRASNEIIQIHNDDFARVTHAAAVRDAMIAAAPDWDWSEPTLFEEMPTAIFHAVWAAIYRAPRDRILTIQSRLS